MTTRKLWALGLTLGMFAHGCSGCNDGGGGKGSIDEGGSQTDAGDTDACTGRAYRCEDNVAVSCDESGASKDCSVDGKSCNVMLGCADCVPGTGSCEDGKATFCRNDGTLAAFECDPVQGMACEANGCMGACSLGEVSESYIGCDYYPTQTLNPVWNGFEFAVAVSNASTETVHVTITRGDEVVVEKDITANQLESIPLPWVDELKGGDSECAVPPGRGVTTLVKQGAYRVRTDKPVTVYQFSPLEYELDPVPAECPVLAQCEGGLETRCLSYSNDASLLLPATALTGNYSVLAWPSQADGSGFMAITATEDETEVEVIGAGGFEAGAGIDAAGKGKVNLDRGDVLQVVADGSSDLSGSRIRASKGVQVIGGHSCAQVPGEGTPNCDHIEEALFPEDTLGSDYFITLPVFADSIASSPYVLRVLAIEKATKLSFDPEIRAPVTIEPGTPFELALTATDVTDLHLVSDKPVLVGQYLEGASVLSEGKAVGDPSMSTTPPSEQYRKTYLFTAPTTYIVNFANVVAPEGASVEVDGKTVPSSAFTAIGSSKFGVARVQLDADTSVHTLDADEEVGLTVYGYGLYTSYMYPGGADLERITIPPLI